MYTSDDELYTQHSHDRPLNGGRHNIVDMQFTASAFVLSAPTTLYGVWVCMWVC